jgi:hypothetical protein
MLKEKTQSLLANLALATFVILTVYLITKDASLVGPL